MLRFARWEGQETLGPMGGAYGPGRIGDDGKMGRFLALPPEREPSLARSTHARSRVAHLFTPRVSELPTCCEPGTARAPSPASGFVLWWQ